MRITASLHGLLRSLLGGVLVSALSNYLSSITPDYWQLVLGITFILVILFFKEGLAGLVTAFAKRLPGRRSHG